MQAHIWNVSSAIHRAVEENISCLSSSKQEEHHAPVPTDLPSALNLSTDTPVGITSGKIQKSDAAPRKRSSLSSILKTFCCLSDPMHSEEPETCSSTASGLTLTQDGGSVLMDSQNNNSSQANPKVMDEDEEACSALTMSPCVTPAGSVFTLRTPLSPVDTRASLFKTPATPPLTLGLNCQGRELNRPEVKHEKTCQETAEVGIDKGFEALEKSNDPSEENDQELEMLCGAQFNSTCRSVPYQDPERACLLNQSACTARPVLGTPSAPKPHTGRVAAHIKLFSSFNLRSLTPKAIRSPIHFQRTPVYKYVKRMNTLIERGCMEQGSYRGCPQNHRWMNGVNSNSFISNLLIWQTMDHSFIEFRQTVQNVWNDICFKSFFNSVFEVAVFSHVLFCVAHVGVGFTGLFLFLMPSSLYCVKDVCTWSICFTVQCSDLSHYFK